MGCLIVLSVGELMDKLIKFSTVKSHSTVNRQCTCIYSSCKLGAGKSISFMIE